MENHISYFHLVSFSYSYQKKYEGTTQVCYTLLLLAICHLSHIGDIILNAFLHRNCLLFNENLFHTSSYTSPCEPAKT